MDKKTVGQHATTVAKYTFLPMQAVDEGKKSLAGIKRIGQMLKNGKPVPLRDLTPEEVQFEQNVREGKGVYMQLEEHERFEYRAEELGWTDEQLANQTKAIKRAHTVRLGILVFSTILYPYILFQYGFIQSMFCLAMVAYTGITCLKNAVELVHLEERAFWSFDQLRARPNFWLYRRAFRLQD